MLCPFAECHPIMFDMEVIVRHQDQEHCASITCMIRHYVARRAQVSEAHPHNAGVGVLHGWDVRLACVWS
jgi:hypothetical protein